MSSATQNNEENKMREEIFAANKFIIEPREEEIESIYRKGHKHTIQYPEQYKCPRCEDAVGQIEHGGCAHCPRCGLYLELWGNGLHVSGHDTRTDPIIDELKVLIRKYEGAK
jgi:ribosomal protein S27AE